MRVVGIGDLAVDYYYKNNKCIGINGGKSSSNIIFNLSYLGIKTAFIGACGNDIQGKICIDSLNKVGVDTKYIKTVNKKTRQYHIDISNNNVINSKVCPKCNTKNWYNISKINVDDTLSYIKGDDIILADNLSSSILKIIEEKCKTNNIILDIGFLQNFIYMDKEEILNLLKDKFKIINMNERVAKYFFNRFKVNDIELSKLFNIPLLIITKGNKGADFIFDNKVISKKLEKKSQEIDTNGAGDAFFATIIAECINNNFRIDEIMIDRAFEKATAITCKVVSSIGSRGHIMDLYKIDRLDNICICQDLKIK
jgi:sugar/nucleoside kinase (ribokinase family)